MCATPFTRRNSMILNDTIDNVLFTENLPTYFSDRKRDES